MTEEHGHAVLGILRDQSVALHPEMLIYKAAEGETCSERVIKFDQRLCFAQRNQEQHTFVVVEEETSVHAHLCSSGSLHSPGS